MSKYCCCNRKPDAHKEIEKQLERDRKTRRKEIEIIFFGKTGSGKTTLFRQLQIIYGDEYSDDEVGYFKRHVYKDIVQTIQALIYSMKVLNIQFQDDENLEMAKRVHSVDTFYMKTISEELANAIKLLWNDRGVQTCLESGSVSVSDSAIYFLNDMDRVLEPGYSPSKQDIVRVFIPTTGIQEYVFEQERHLFRITEMGGFNLHTFRCRKLLFQFIQTIHVIFYVADISVFEKTVEGSDSENEVVEAVDLFKLVVLHPWVSRTSVVLFLNKIDLFKEKLKRHNLHDHFPEYIGPEHDVEAGCHFMKNLFLAVQAEENRPIFPHFTCAIDTPGMKRVFDNIIQYTVQSNIKKHKLL
ncbi:guanine nucleotide-binding protein subunit alpha-14-like [Ruditapes philippinarum]|uniref:guanine nucleotide-binding protein subunit alpha-14-like n=1 Tax=Ruditapes philippinarum TaxID=129788 RepID=UPI00295C275C|nr:guanine nucleotide-binding protein subunit alpha-14-like [Ruditapes philippinarum]